ncbi:MAG: hypothetical protein WC107_04885 [Patescibacteria group bacterium]
MGNLYIAFLCHPEPMVAFLCHPEPVILKVKDLSVFLIQFLHTRGILRFLRMTALLKEEYLIPNT